MPHSLACSSEADVVVARPRPLSPSSSSSESDGHVPHPRHRLPPCHRGIIYHPLSSTDDEGSCTALPLSRPHSSSSESSFMALPCPHSPSSESHLRSTTSAIRPRPHYPTNSKAGRPTIRSPDSGVESGSASPQPFRRPQRCTGFRPIPDVECGTHHFCYMPGVPWHGQTLVAISEMPPPRAFRF